MKSEKSEKQKWMGYQEENRLFALDYFETNEMDNFLQNIADAMFSDIPSVLTMISYIPFLSLRDFHTYESGNGESGFAYSRTYCLKGLTPIEICHHLHTYPIFGEYDKDRNYVNNYRKLARCLFYNVPENRGEIER